MKISIKTAGLALLLTACSNAGTEGPATQEKILPYSIYQHRLDNGLNVVTVPFDSPGLAAFHIVTRVGAMNDVEPGVTGFAHFFEHMMFRGTDKYPKEKYRDALKSTGAAANADTELEVTADGTNISVKQTAPYCSGESGLFESRNSSGR